MVVERATYMKVAGKASALALSACTQAVGKAFAFVACIMAEASACLTYSSLENSQMRHIPGNTVKGIVTLSEMLPHLLVSLQYQINKSHFLLQYPILLRVRRSRVNTNVFVT